MPAWAVQRGASAAHCTLVPGVAQSASTRTCPLSAPGSCWHVCTCSTSAMHACCRSTLARLGQLLPERDCLEGLRCAGLVSAHARAQGACETPCPPGSSRTRSLNLSVSSSFSTSSLFITVGMLSFRLCRQHMSSAGAAADGGPAAGCMQQPLGALLARCPLLAKAMGALARSGTQP